VHEFDALDRMTHGSQSSTGSTDQRAERRRRARMVAGAAVGEPA